MFLRFYKGFILKKIVKKNFSDNERQISEIKIKSVALLIDSTRFKAINELVALVEKQGIQQVKAFAFTRDKKAESSENIVYFRSEDIETSGRFKNKALENQFLYPYDLLINYYDEKTVELLYLSSVSKADFRVGFKQNHLGKNDFMIDVNLTDYQVFIDELFKYLKNFNKI